MEYFVLKLPLKKKWRDVCYKLVKARKLKRKDLGTSCCLVGLKMGNFQAEYATRNREKHTHTQSNSACPVPPSNPVPSSNLGSKLAYFIGRKTKVER